jgi:hypothetical protein
MHGLGEPKRPSGPFAFQMDQNPTLLPPDLPIPGLPGKTILDFWRWAYSDVVSNRNRAVYAEYIVGAALGCVDTPRIEWDAVDLRYGNLKIEVKSSAYHQSWRQSKPSRISFNIKRAKAWDSTTGETSPDSRRTADVYVICHCRAPNNTAAAMLDINSWDFYVVPTSILDQALPTQKTAALTTIQRLAVPCGFSNLPATVRNSSAMQPSL